VASWRIAVGLLKLGSAPMVNLFVAGVFVIGLLASVVGIQTIHKGHRYYRHTVVKKTLMEDRLGLTKPLDLVKASKMNMVMNNDGAGSLFQANSLDAPPTWEPDLVERKLMGRVDVLFTNPPFGSKIPVDQPSILEKHDLGYIWNYDKETDRWIKSENIQKSQPPEILFIERCVKFLKPGTGQLAIVLPDGILGSPGLGYVRQWILNHTKVLASIDLHPDTFQPDVSIQTSVLVLQRKSADLIAAETAD
jgi:type I restriction enzyme M protein